MDNRASIPQQNNFISSKHKRSETTYSFAGCPSKLHHLRCRQTRKILVGEGCRRCSQPKSPQHYRSPAASPPRFSSVFIAQPVIRKQRAPMAAIDATSAKSRLLRFRSSAPSKQREPSNQVRPSAFVAPPGAAVTEASNPHHQIYNHFTDLTDAIKAAIKKVKSSASRLELDSDNHHCRGGTVSVGKLKLSHKTELLLVCSRCGANATPTTSPTKSWCLKMSICPASDNMRLQFLRRESEERFPLAVGCNVN
ncbi:hypothetical protein LR48_Vigan03g069600 [Vigna angularis]|uniref:Uncharacterized protein n=1 Tax=Phaseolus angularis TaxID=3914 RepID=A0A0L9U3F0_PHAAN|nr:hypothetical protein LR48_Vigan03g069600 [Vigna angularis]